LKDTAKNTKPTISIIMPVYKLSKQVINSIEAVKRTLEAYNHEYEIIVVDDGSPDDTYTHAQSTASNPSIKAYRLPRNMGKGFALLHGYRRSQGDIVVFFDGDLDIHPKQIPLLVNLLRNSQADIAITSKWHPQSKTTATPLRKFLSKSFHALARLLLGVKVTDTQTGAKAFKRRVLEDVARHLIVKRYAFDAELLAAATTKGYRVIEAPALWRIKLTSTFKVKELLKMMLDLAAAAYRLRVNKPTQQSPNPRAQQGHH